MTKKLGKHPDRRTAPENMAANVGGRARQTLVINYGRPSQTIKPILQEPRRARTYFDGVIRLLYEGPANLVYTAPKSPALGFVTVWRENLMDCCTEHYSIHHPASTGSLWAGYANNNHPRTTNTQTAGHEYDLELIADLSAAVDFVGRGVRKIRFIDEIADLACSRTLDHGERGATAVAYESNQEGLAVIATTHLRDDTTTFLAFPATNIADAEAMLSSARMNEPTHNIPGALGLSLWRKGESVDRSVSFLLAQVALTADI